MTINEAQDKIIAEFSNFADWIDKCEYLIELGKNHTITDTKFKVEEYVLPGCQSQVWIYPEVKDNLLSFLVDSDSVIIKGILVLLLRVLNNKLPKDIAQADLYFVKAIGLSTNLSPTRAIGIASIIKQMKKLAGILDK
jgi:cysteine desulfuration protein SufE